MAKENGIKKRVSISDFYRGLSRGEKGRFMVWVQMKTLYSQNTVMKRLNCDGWSEAERDYIERGIETEAWRGM